MAKIQAKQVENVETKQKEFVTKKRTFEER